MSDNHAKQTRHWLKKASEAEGNSNDEEALAARYTAGASARLWALGKLDDDHDDSSDVWSSVKEHAEKANKHQDDEDQDQALFHRALANIYALRAFESSDEAGDSGDSNDSSDDDKDDDDEVDGKKDKDEDD